MIALQINQRRSKSTKGKTMMADLMRVLSRLGVDKIGIIVTSARMAETCFAVITALGLSTSSA